MAQQFTSPLLAPDLQRKQMEFQQNQMLAKALMQQGMQPNEGRMISGHYVRPDAGRAIANAFSLYAGMKGMQDAPQQMADLQKAQQDYTLSGFGFKASPQQLGQALSGGNAQAFPVGPSGAAQQPAVQDKTQQPMLLPGMNEAQSRNMLLTMGPERYAQALANASGRMQGMSGLVPTDQGYAYRKPDGSTGFLTGDDGAPLMPVSLLNQDPTRQGAVAQARAQGTETGKATAQAKFEAPKELATADQMLATIDAVGNHKGLDSAVGWIQGRLPVMGEDATDFKAKLDQLQGQLFLQAYQTLKGGGQITEVEGAKAEAAMAALTRAQSEGQFKSALKDLRDVVVASKDRIEKRAGGNLSLEKPRVQSTPSGIQSIQSAADYESLPSGAIFIAPDGSQRRKP